MTDFLWCELSHKMLTERPNYESKSNMHILKDITDPRSAKSANKSCKIIPIQMPRLISVFAVPFAQKILFVCGNEWVNLGLTSQQHVIQRWDLNFCLIQKTIESGNWTAHTRLVILCLILYVKAALIWQLKHLTYLSG